MSTTGGPMPSERADDGIDALAYAQSEVSALTPRPSAAYPRPQEDAPRPDLMAAVKEPTVRVSNLLAQGACVGGRSHPHPHLYPSLRRYCSSWYVTHDPKAAFDAVDAVVPRYSL
jgi:hypothetical protein